MELGAVDRGTGSTSTARLWTTAPMLACALAIALGAGFGISRVNASRDVLVLALIGAILLTPIAIRVAQRRFDPFEPIVVFGAAFGVMFVVRPVAMLSEGEFVYERSSRAIAIDSTFSEMTMLAALGAIAFVGAYALPIGRRIAASATAPRTTFDSSRVGLGALVTAGVGLAFTAVFIANTGHGLDFVLAGRSTELTQAYRSSSAYLSHGPFLLVPSALMLFVVGRACGRRGFVVMAGAITLILLLLSVPTGGRMLLLPFVGGALVYRYVSRDARPRLVTLGLLALLGLFASTLLLNARPAAQGGLLEAASSTLHHPQRMLEPLMSGSDAEMAPALAASLTIVPEDLDFMRGGATIGDFLTRPIPRELWNEKPLSPREAVIARVWPAEYLASVANPEFSALLYFYLDFALLGVAIGMASYGVIARAIYEYFRAHDENLVVRLLFAFSVPFVVIAMRDSPVDTFVRGVFVFIPILLVFRLAALRSPGTGRI